MLNLWICDHVNDGMRVHPIDKSLSTTAALDPDTSMWPLQQTRTRVSPYTYPDDAADRSTVRSDAQLLQVPVVSIGGSMADTRSSTAGNAASKPTASRRTFYKRSANVKVFGTAGTEESSETKKPFDDLTVGFPCPSHDDPVSTLQPEAVVCHHTQADAQTLADSEDLVHFHDMYSKLCMFKNTFGHTNVPKVTSWFLLGSWVQQLRKRKKVQSLRERGINVATELPPLAMQHVQMLDAVGFSWQAPSFNESESIIATIKNSKANEETSHAQGQGSNFPAPVTAPAATSCQAFPNSNGNASISANAHAVNDMDSMAVKIPDIDAMSNSMTPEHQDDANMVFPTLRWDYDQSQGMTHGSDQSFGSGPRPSSQSSMQDVAQCNQSVDNQHSIGYENTMSAPFTSNSNHFRTHSQTVSSVSHGAGNHNYIQGDLPAQTFRVTSDMYSNRHPASYGSQCGRPMTFAAPSEVYSSQQSAYGSQCGGSNPMAFTAPSEVYSSHYAPSAYGSQYGGSNPMTYAMPSEVQSSRQSAYGSQCGGTVAFAAPSEVYMTQNAVYGSQCGGSNTMAFSAPSEVYSSHHSVYSGHSSSSPHPLPSNHSIDFSTMSTKSSNSDRFKHQIGMKRKGAPIHDQDTMSCSSQSSHCVAERNWKLKYNSLMKFKADTGHCDVPARHDEDPKLGHWVMTQRRQYHLMQKGKATRMTRARIELLERAGLQWSVRMNPTNLWNSRLHELHEYKEKHGNCLVPQRYSKNPQLGTW
jgi:hypothetical protein